MTAPDKATLNYLINVGVGKAERVENQNTSNKNKWWLILNLLWIVVNWKLINKRIGEDSLAKKAKFIENKKCGGPQNF